MKKAFSLTGNITFSAIGAYVEEFISELMNSGIYLYNVHNNKDTIYISSKRKDYLRISKIARKYRVQTRIEERKGLYFKIKKLKNRSGILIGLVLSIFILLIMQQFIWKIDINGVDKLTENLILKTISENNIHLGCLSSEIDTEFTELILKNKLNQIGWIDIRVNGSKLDIEIYEKQLLNKPEIPLSTPCNVIASRDGVIVDTEVYSGTLMYPKGSGVAAGNVIVSGIVNDGADNLILSHANARIIAEFNEKIEIRQNFKTIEKQQTGITETEKELMLFGFVIPITEKVNLSDNKICNEEIKICEISGIRLPWKIKTNTYYTYENVNVTRTDKDSLRLIEQKFDMYCKNFFSDYEIIDISKEIKTDNDGITLFADVKMRGNIAVQQEIFKKYE